MIREPDHPTLIGNGAHHALPNPPACVGRETAALFGVEFLRRANQAEIAFLDEIFQADAVAFILLGDADDKSQVVGDKLKNCFLIASSSPSCYRNLFLTC